MSESDGVRSDLNPLDPMQAVRPGLLQLSSLPPLSLYVHLPWCLQKCPYCDFNSHAWRGAALQGKGLPADEPLQRAYMQALLADLEASLPLIWGRSVQTVFFGGGTPSLFAPEVIGDFIDALRARLRGWAEPEVTLEANPGTFERERFAAFRDAGVNRLSIGVQSFDDAHLAAIGRVHNGAQALAAVQEAARVFETFNLDLMYALPGQTLAQQAQDLQTALSLAPPHLSVYHLTIEPNTVFASRPPVLPDDDLAFAMLDQITEATARVGLARYEVSAYAREGHRCQHNLNYWQFGDYLGIGAGAHSKLSFAHRIVRQVRYREPSLYVRQAQQGQPVAQHHEVARRDLPFEFMLNALRLREGFALADFQSRTGLPTNALEAGLAQAERQGLIERDLWRVKPTERGFDFLSDLQALFLADA
jgi:putative oxygen-independent coproporphyrinogen III oxidase